MLRSLSKATILAGVLTGSMALAQDPYLRPSLDAREALANDNGVIPQLYVAMTNATICDFYFNVIIFNVSTLNRHLV